MEKELESKIFMVQDYSSKEEMEKNIKEYISKLKKSYPYAIVTREFYKGRNILIRATKIFILSKRKNDYEKENQLEKEEVRIKEKGINGLGENVPKIVDGRYKKEKTRGNEGRERC
jgi:hypothetical protein